MKSKNILRKLKNKTHCAVKTVRKKLSNIPFEPKHKKLALILVTTIVVVIVMFAFLKHHQSQQSEQAQQLNAAIYYQVQKSSKDLNVISQQVVDLTDQLNQQHSVVEIDAIKSSLEKITTQIQSMKDENSDSLTQLMKNQSTEMNQKLDALQAGVTALQVAEKKVVFLPEKELPFLVESVDLIQQQPVVTVRYDYKSQPLDIGYSLAGWELVRADFSKQSAEFRNHKDQHILIHLTQRGSMA